MEDKLHYAGWVDGLACPVSIGIAIVKRTPSGAESVRTRLGSGAPSYPG